MTLDQVGWFVRETFVQLQEFYVTEVEFELDIEGNKIKFIADKK